MKRLLSLAVAAMLALAGATPPAAAQATQTLRIALIPGDISGEADYAQDLGYFKKAGFDVEFTPITGGAAISAPVASGAVDIGFSNIVSLSIAHEKGVPFTLLAPANLHMPAQVTAGILTVLKNGPIKSAKDLDGKTVAVNSLNNISSVSVQAWVDKNGGDWKSVKFVEMPFPQMPDAVRAGRVDAASMRRRSTQRTNSCSRSRIPICAGWPTSSTPSARTSHHRPGLRRRPGPTRIRQPSKRSSQ